ncbi:hypothetical protein HN011_000950, partial [Eciton burchellii]
SDNCTHYSRRNPRLVTVIRSRLYEPKKKRNVASRIRPYWRQCHCARTKSGARSSSSNDMTTTFLQRSIIIFAILLCCFQFWVDAVDCEKFPYHASCRGMMTRKRAFNRGQFIESEESRVPRMRYLIALLDNAHKIKHERQAKRMMEDMPEEEMYMYHDY